MPIDRPRSSPLPSFLLAPLEVLCVAVLAIIAVGSNAGLFWRATLFLSKNRNEGWNATHEQLLAATGTLYHPLAELANNNYPPLSFYVVRFAMHAIPDAIFAGRAIAIIAYLVCLAAIFAIVAALYARILPALVAALIFAGLMAMNATDYVTADDPQMLGHALMLIGLAIGVLADFSIPTTILCAVFITLGLFDKHNIIALPIAIALFLLFRDRRAFVAFALTGILATVLLGAAAWWRFGPAMISNLLFYRDYSLTRAVNSALDLLMPMTTLLLLAMLNLFIGRLRARRFLFVLWVAIAIVIGTVALSGLGVVRNAMFEVVIATALAVGCLLGELEAAERGALRAWCVLAACAGVIFTPGLLQARAILSGPSWMRIQRADEAASQQLVQAIAATSGPALCENLQYCYWAGKKFALDGISILPAQHAGLHPEREVLAHIRNRDYAAIQVSAQDEGSMLDVLSSEAFPALRENYREVPLTTHIARLFVPAP